ncbi:MAG: hypothetical protein PF447_03250 [Spirochaetaceae bacterium]|jgi:hypothetical protein|nr:hypothetical protein [Spirochaetaceae bacterium]
MSNEENLTKLKKTSILMNFIKKNQGQWDHQQWLELCETIKDKGYDPIDLDQVGLILEEKKKKFLEG